MPQKLVQPAGLDKVRFTTKRRRKAGRFKVFIFWRKHARVALQNRCEPEQTFYSSYNIQSDWEWRQLRRGRRRHGLKTGQRQGAQHSFGRAHPQICRSCRDVTPGKEVRCARRPRIFVSHVEASHELDERCASGMPRVGSRPVLVRKRAVLHPTRWFDFVLFGRQAARNPVAAHLTQGLADDPHRR